jgi:CheY-like chemotaxis protein
VLRYEGYSVAAAANGREAIDHLRERGRPCVILLDLMMPIMDGWQFRAEQLRDPGLAPIPVIVISAGADIERKASSLGAVGFSASRSRSTPCSTPSDATAERRDRCRPRRSRQRSLSGPGATVNGERAR